MAAVVEDVFAVVGGVEQGRGGILRRESVDEQGYQAVGVTYGVVVAVDQRGAVGGFRLVGIVGQEVGHRARIAFAIFEVRTVGVQHDELFAPLPTQHLVYRCQQVGIVAVAGSGVRAGSGFFDKLPLVGLLAEKVDERVIGQLVGEENGVESRLAEGRDDALPGVDAVVVGGRHG